METGKRESTFSERKIISDKLKLKLGEEFT